MLTAKQNNTDICEYAVYTLEHFDDTKGPEWLNELGSLIT